jgi:excisionase family DNA binding protein
MLLSDVAAELNVSDSQVYHMVRRGELPAIKIGGRGQWRVERAKLEHRLTPFPRLSTGLTPAIDVPRRAPAHSLS